jgi:hypothetical protein
VTGEDRRRFFPGGISVLVAGWESPRAYPHTFWSEPISLFGSLSTYEVYRRFTCVRHILQALLPAALRLTALPPPRSVGFTPSGIGLLCQEALDVSLPSAPVSIGY